jgi:hypothetical protein
VPTANIAIRLRLEDLESLDGQAEREGRSRSGQARYIIREHLAQQGRRSTVTNGSSKREPKEPA